MPLPEGFTLRSDPIGDIAGGDFEMPTEDEIGMYIASAADQRGIPVQDAFDVWGGEGRATGLGQSRVRRSGAGSLNGYEDSWGPYQMYRGGGLGNELETKGVDVSNPRNWKKSIDHALDHAQKHGWGAWYGAPPELRARGGYTNPAGGADTPMGAMGKSSLPPGFKLRQAAPPAPPQPEPVAAPAPAPEAPPPNPENFAGGANMPWSAVGDDAMNSTIASGADLGMSLAALPGDIAGWVGGQAEKYGYGDVEIPGAHVTLGALKKNPFQSENIRNVQTPAGRLGDLAEYTPKSGAGEIIQDVMPYTVGAGGKGVSAARKALNVGGVAAAGAAGQQIGGTPGEILAATATAAKMGKGKIPKGFTSTARAFASGTRGYEAAKASGVEIKGNRFYAFARGLEKDPEIQSILSKPNLTGSLHSDVKALLDEVKGPPPKNYMMGMPGQKQAGWNPTNIDVKRFDELRRGIGKHLKSNDANERRAAHEVMDKLDGIWKRSSNFTGDPTKVKEVLNQARQDWKVGSKAKTLDTIQRLIDNRTPGLSQSGRENAVRLEFKKLADRIAKYPSEASKWTPEETKQIEKLARVGFGGRYLLRQAARFMGPNAITAPLSLGYGMQTGDWSGAAKVAAIGVGGRVLGGRTAQGQANRLKKLTLAGGKKVNANPQLPYWAALSGSGLLEGDK